MTLSNVEGDIATATSDILDGSSSNWDSLYCSHLWTNSYLRNAIINNANIIDNNKMIKYCYTCKGKVRKYEIKSPTNMFLPNIHSTPNGKNLVSNAYREGSCEVDAVSLTSSNNRSAARDNEPCNTEGDQTNQCIPSISRQVDSSVRHKYATYDTRPTNVSHRRLRKSLKGIGCVVSLALTDSPVKKRTQIQACSISVMIVAIVVISFVLVNFTSPNLKSNKSSTVVPTKITSSNKTTLAVTNIDLQPPRYIETTSKTHGSVEALVVTTENSTKLTDLIAKIRKNIKTYPKDGRKSEEKPKEINNRDLSLKFCSCQTYEVCMLNESSGTAICKKAVDIDDPTGCGGLCALETEACQLVDRARAVRVCRLVTLLTCTAQEWRCRNGLCVDKQARCDGSIQCYDRSDEMHCNCDLTKQFHCGHSISCFPNSKRCDGVIDCYDGFDEVNCTTACPGDQFTCTNGQCIAASRFCDGLADCEDGSDEPRGCDADCGSQEFGCRNHRCVLKTAICDGVDDCGDGTDELNCS